MKRSSIKKASTFKLQGERNKFLSYLENVQNCSVAKRYPQLTEMIKQTSEAVYNYCYSFKDDSPFNRGLNYESKCIGFSFNDNVFHYKEWLPKIKQAFIMGEFNQFNKNSHKLEKSEEDDIGWYKIDLDLTGSHIEDGSKMILRVIDHQNTQFYMIPPSCHIVDNGYGILKRNQILPISKKKYRINSLLAYTIDLNNLSLQKCIEFLQSQQQFLSSFNTIILKNLFKSTYGLIHNYSVEFKDLEKLRNIVLTIKNDCKCKAVIEWNLQPGKAQYIGNPVEDQFLKMQSSGKYEFNFTKSQVIAYYLANASFFYQNLSIDGIHFTNIEHALKSRQGMTVLKCLNVLNARIIDSGITLGSSKHPIQTLLGDITEGGCGFSFTYNHHSSLALQNSYQELYGLVQKINSQSNCLAINLQEYDESHILNLIFTLVVSYKGVFTKGDFLKLGQNLYQILKLRCQDKLFDNEISKIKLIEKNSTAIIERGATIVLFNFGSEEVSIDIQNSSNMEVVYTYNTQNVQITDNKVRLTRQSCVLLENFNTN